MQNKQYLLIENKGEIDINALILMGGSTKREDTTKRGYFGSGNKYAIALMLKKEIDFKIFSGLNEIVVNTKNVEFRDKSFKQILVNGQETSLTTEMGPQWDSWMSIRETLANSMDEGDNNVVLTTENISPKEGYTRIYINHHDDIKYVIDNWNTYFSLDRDDILFENSNGKIFSQTDTKNETQTLYRKGIQCYYGKGQKSLFHYDLEDFPINESRVISEMWTAKKMSCEFLCKNATKKIAQKILGNAFTGENHYWEGQFEWYYYGSNKLSDTWKEAVGKKVIVVNDVSGFFLDVIGKKPHYRVSKEMAKALKGSFPEMEIYGLGEEGENDTIYKPFKSTPKIDFILKKALEFLKESDYHITHPIKIVEFDKKETLGLAANNTIYLSEKVFDIGLKEVVTTLLEESTHLKTGYADETKSLELYLFRMWTSEMELRIGQFL